MRPKKGFGLMMFPPAPAPAPAGLPFTGPKAYCKVRMNMDLGLIKV